MSSAETKPNSANTVEATAAADRVNIPYRSKIIATVGSAKVFRLTREVDGMTSLVILVAGKKVPTESLSLFSEKTLHS